MLDASLSSMFKEAGQLTEDDWETVRSMCEVIFEQTKALDEKVDYFMKCADGDTNELLNLVANADMWATKVTKSGDK
ncbi:MAG: hypothetical protein R6V56_06350 [Lentisphaeria bacterium]